MSELGVIGHTSLGLKVGNRRDSAVLREVGARQVDGYDPTDLRDLGALVVVVPDLSNPEVQTQADAFLRLSPWPPVFLWTDYSKVNMKYLMARSIPHVSWIEDGPRALRRELSVAVSSGILRPS